MRAETEKQLHPTARETHYNLVERTALATTAAMAPTASRTAAASGFVADEILQGQIYEQDHHGKGAGNVLLEQMDHLRELGAKYCSAECAMQARQTVL